MENNSSKNGNNSSNSTKPDWLTKLNFPSAQPKAEPLAHAQSPSQPTIPDVIPDDATILDSNEEEITIALPTYAEPPPLVLHPLPTLEPATEPEFIHEPAFNYEAEPTIEPEPEPEPQPEHNVVKTAQILSWPEQFTVNEETLVESVSEDKWAGLLTPSESISYDNHVRYITDIVHRTQLIGLKGFFSKYLRSNITNPEQAETHIRMAKIKREDVGGWQTSDHKMLRQAQLLISAMEKREKSKQQRSRYYDKISVAREEWKNKVLFKKIEMERLDDIVQRAHEEYKHMKAMTFEQYLVEFEPEL